MKAGYKICVGPESEGRSLRFYNRAETQTAVSGPRRRGATSRSDFAAISRQFRWVRWTYKSSWLRPRRAEVGNYLGRENKELVDVRPMAARHEHVDIAGLLMVYLVCT